MKTLLQIGFLFGNVASLALGFVAFFGYQSIPGALWAMAASNACSAGLWGSMARQSAANARAAEGMRQEYQRLLANYELTVRRQVNLMLRTGDPGDREVGS